MDYLTSLRVFKKSSFDKALANRSKNISVRSSFPTLNKRFNVRHLAVNLHFDKKLTALLTRTGYKTLAGKLTILTGETEIS